jgi:hypothetical protein
VIETLPSTVLAADSFAANSKEWLDLAKSGLGVAAVIVSIPYSIRVFKKIKLDSRKTELDIRKQELELAGETGNLPTNSAAHEGIIAPSVNAQRVQDMILRFVMLYLAITGWNIVSDFVDLVSTAPAAFGIFNVTWVDAIAYLLMLIISAIPPIGIALIALGLGGPLVYDVARHLNLTVPSWLSFIEHPGRRAYVLVGVAVFFAHGGSRLFQ